MENMMQQNVILGEKHQEPEGTEYNLYKDIQSRTNNELFLGVVGPVRTGKSTFIKRFMDICVLPNMTDPAEKLRAQDEMPQSSGGKTVTTTEPKFIPKEAAEIQLADGIRIMARLIDCVGYMVEGAAGHMENGTERMVKTPWSEEEIPFTKAAEIGTRKVIRDHATIGIVITTDGSFGDLERSSYIPAEEETILELKALGKPFIVLVNTMKPYGEEAVRIAGEIENTYQVRAMPVNVEQLKKQDILHILEQVLYEFPLTVISFYLPKWVETLSDEHPMKKDLLEKITQMKDQIDVIRDVVEKKMTLQSP